jgi:hypothetical protein
MLDVFEAEGAAGAVDRGVDGSAFDDERGTGAEVVVCIVLAMLDR